MTFKGGAMHGVKAELRPSRHERRPPLFSLLAENGKAAAITCTYTTNP
jgi:hypothetical protein